MADPKHTLWQWRVRLKPDALRDPWFSHKTWKKLRWRMTEAEAAEWGVKNGCEIEKIPHSGEQSTGYLGFDGPSAPMCSSPDKRKLVAAENDAKARGTGLWQDKQPVPPWEWRNKNRSRTSVN